MKTNNELVENFLRSYYYYVKTGRNQDEVLDMKGEILFRMSILDDVLEVKDDCWDCYYLIQEIKKRMKKIDS